jgi:hypothetical protein
MSEFNIRSESVDVEQIMKQIRQRILEKRGADYTEDQIRELASVRLEKFLDPKNLRSDLLEQFRKSRPAVEPVDIQPPKIQPPYVFDDQTLFASHRGLMRFARKLLSPFLKLMFNPNTLNQVLHTQAQFNVDILKREARRSVEQRQLERSRGEWNALYYEVLHNIVLETTRMGIEVQNLRMKVESLSSRLDFSERRVRALEGVVQYRPEVVRSSERHHDAEEDHAPSPQQASTGGLEGFVPAGVQPQGPGDGAGRKRRRRRRGRRGGQGTEANQGASGAASAFGASGAGAMNAPGTAGEQGFDNGDDDENGDEGENGEGFDVPEPLERPEALDTSFESAQTSEISDSPQAPQEHDAPKASAFAQEPSDELRRDKPDSEDDLQ